MRSILDTRKPRKLTCTCWTFSYCFRLEIAPPSNSTVAGEQPQIELIQDFRSRVFYTSFRKSAIQRRLNFQKSSLDGALSRTCLQNRYSEVLYQARSEAAGEGSACILGPCAHPVYEKLFQILKARRGIGTGRGRV